MQLLKIEMTKRKEVFNLLPMVEENNNSTFSSRLKSLIDKRNISITDLSKETGVTYEMVRRYTIGLAKPRTPIMLKLALALGVDAAYLEYGAGPTSFEPGSSESTASVYRVDVLDLAVSAGPGTYMLSDYVEVLHAIEFTTDHARELFGKRSQGDVKVMTVDGDSMTPTMRSGDRLFFDVSVRNFVTDGVYAFVYGRTFHVKRLQMQGKKMAVLSDNPSYEKWYVEEEDQFYVMGKALIHESLKYNKL